MSLEEHPLIKAELLGRKPLRTIEDADFGTLLLVESDQHGEPKAEEWYDWIGLAPFASAVFLCAVEEFDVDEFNFETERLEPAKMKLNAEGGRAIWRALKENPERFLAVARAAIAEAIAEQAGDQTLAEKFQLEWIAFGPTSTSVLRMRNTHQLAHLTAWSLDEVSCEHLTL
jgi:hypothetical protein